MAEQKKNGAGPSPAEDMYGRPTTVRGEPTEGLPPSRGAAADDDGEENWEQDADETPNPRGASAEERDPREAFNAIPDGDGPRSDRGTNPLPETYWSAYPDKERK